MHLVSTVHYNRDKRRRTLSSLRERMKRSRLKRHHPCDGWLRMCHKIREPDIRWKTQTKASSDILRRVLPHTAKRELLFPEPELTKQLIDPKSEAKTPLCCPPYQFLRQRKRWYMRPLNRDLFPVMMMTSRRRRGTDGRRRRRKCRNRSWSPRSCSSGTCVSVRMR